MLSVAQGGQRGGSVPDRFPTNHQTLHSVEAADVLGFDDIHCRSYLEVHIDLHPFALQVGR